MRRRRAAVEQAGIGEDERAGAHAGQQRARGGKLAQPRADVLAARAGRASRCRPGRPARRPGPSWSQVRSASTRRPFAHRIGSRRLRHRTSSTASSGQLAGPRPEAPPTDRRSRAPRRPRRGRSRCARAAAYRRGPPARVQRGARGRLDLCARRCSVGACSPSTIVAATSSRALALAAQLELAAVGAVLLVLAGLLLSREIRRWRAAHPPDSDEVRARARDGRAVPERLAGADHALRLERERAAGGAALRRRRWSRSTGPSCPAPTRSRRRRGACGRRRSPTRWRRWSTTAAPTRCSNGSSARPTPTTIRGTRSSVRPPRRACARRLSRARLLLDLLPAARGRLPLRHRHRCQRADLHLPRRPRAAPGRRDDPRRLVDGPATGRSSCAASPATSRAAATRPGTSSTAASAAAQGGGWPATFVDVAAAIDHLRGARRAARPRARDALGHSAGGQLALWAAGRASASRRRSRRAPRASSRSPPSPPPASTTSRRATARRRTAPFGVLMGGGPDERPERYAIADPIARVPLPMPVLLVHGTDDATVSVRRSRNYAAAARAAGGEVELVELAGAAGRPPQPRRPGRRELGARSRLARAAARAGPDRSRDGAAEPARQPATRRRRAARGPRRRPPC